MRLVQMLQLRWRTLFLRRDIELELDEELRYHLERQIDEYVAAGMTAEEARYAASRSIDGLEQRKEECRDMRGMNVIDSLTQDIRFAGRQMLKSPGFTATATMVLAIGVCASVAIFAFVDAALLKPLPYAQPSRLAGVFETSGQYCPSCNLSYPDYLDWKKQNTAFRSLDVYQNTGFTLRTPSGAKPVRATRVSEGFFRTLGVAPILGRDFYAGEDLPSASRSLLLSYGTWQQRFGGRKNVVGTPVTLDGETNVIIGVLPRDFHFAPGEPAEFWVALHPESECDLRRSCHGLYGVGRLKDGVSFDAALLDVKLIAKRLEKQYPGSNRDQGAAIQPLTEVIVGNVRVLLLVLWGGAGVLFVIATVNIASLLLVRSESRKREMAVRAALGAGRARLVRQFITEGLVLVAIGTVTGLALAWGAMHLLINLVPAEMLGRTPFFLEVGFNPRVLAFAALIGAGATVLFSLTPALHTSLWKMRDALAEGSRGSAGNTWSRIGSKLVVSEIALAMVLLVAAGLLGRSLLELLRVNIGMQPDHLSTVFAGAPRSRYSKNDQAVALGRQVVSRIESLPGVRSAALTTDIPVTGWGDTTWFRVVGKPWHGEHNDTPERDVSSRYFRTIGATLLRGRLFADNDDESKPKVAIINRSLANTYFAVEDPIGKQISGLSDPPKPIEIVGEVEDIKEGQLDTANRPALYFPFNQNPGNDFIVVVRSGQEGGSLLKTIDTSLHGIDPDMVTTDARTMRDRIENSPAAYIHRSSAWLVGAFAVAALLLSVVGLYGVVAYSVSQRTREIGVRMALGAHSGTVYRLVLQQAGRLAGYGIVIGVVCAIGSAKLMSGLLFGVPIWDPATLGTVAGLLGSLALLASYIPARRATLVNPIEALRVE